MKGALPAKERPLMLLLLMTSMVAEAELLRVRPLRMKGSGESTVDV